MTLGILGRTALRIDGEWREDWGAPREHALLAALLANAGQWMSLDSLVDWVWHEDCQIPRNRVATFHTYASRIRRWLERLPTPPSLQACRGGYQLNVDRSQIDYYRFRALIDQAHGSVRDTDFPATTRLAGEALGLWRGRPLEDVTTGVAQAWRRRVELNEWVPVNALLIRAQIELGDLPLALARLDDLQVEYARDVDLAKLRLSTLCGLARFPEASAYYLRTRQALRAETDDLGADHLRQHWEAIHARTRQAATTTAPVSRDYVLPPPLPRDVAEFAGRTDLLASLDTATAAKPGEHPTGVVILDGITGVGKTTLAVHWAHRTRQRWSDGVLHVDLGGFGPGPALSHAAVVDEFLIALGHPPDNHVTPRSRELLLSRLLDGRRVLVVLDNARDTAQIANLVPLLTGALVLVTSRRQLSTLTATTGARRVHVPPMTAEESLRLLSMRLAHRPDIGARNRARMAELCGGLPLVITLLAERAANRPDAATDDFVSRLTRQELVCEVGDDGDGEATPASFFAWSYNVLTPAQQRLFRLLTQHPGLDISAEAACACDGGAREETLRTLQTLVAAHLLQQPTASSRYRFHDLIREFAIRRTELDQPPAERRAAQRRILSFYLASATNAHHALYPTEPCGPGLALESGVEPIVIANREQARTWLDRERANLKAVIRDAIDHGHFDYGWRLPHAVATDYRRHGLYDDSIELGEIALSAAQADGHQDAEAATLAELGALFLIRDDPANARVHFEKALRMATGSGDAHAETITLHHLARVEIAQGGTARGLQLYQRSLDTARGIDDRRGQCWTHLRMGEVFEGLGRLDEAFIYLHKAQYFAELIDDRSARAATLNALGTVFRDRAEYTVAIGYCRQALTIAQSIPDLAFVAKIATTLARICHDRGDHDAALHQAEHARALFERLHIDSDTARTLDLLGTIHFDSGDHQQAEHAWQQALQHHTSNGDTAQAALTRARGLLHR